MLKSQCFPCTQSLTLSHPHDSPNGLLRKFINRIGRSPGEKKAAHLVFQRVEDHLTGSEAGVSIDKVQLHGSTATGLDLSSRLA